MRRRVAALAGLVLGMTLITASASLQAADFRIYRANKQLQQDRVLARNEDEPGCHNMLLTITVYRVAQIGYEYCTVYSERDCESGSEIPVTWKLEDAPVKQFTQGARWFLVGENPRGHKMGSWYCQARG